jgi:ribosomal protein L37AE/L43A
VFGNHAQGFFQLLAYRCWLSAGTEVEQTFYFGEIMRSRHKNQNMELVRMELKYCEHCGGLWVREGGAGVYCERCEAKVAELPAPKKRSGRVMLPVQRPTVVGKCGAELAENLDLEAAGGVA